MNTEKTAVANNPSAGYAQQKGESPALMMAGRIRKEQGAERAAQYLEAMEPFIAPGERSHIAHVLGLPQPVETVRQNPAPPQGFPQNMGMGMGMGGMGNLANIGNIMNLMQLMNGFKGDSQQSQSPNPMQIAQLLGGLMGGGAK